MSKGLYSKTRQWQHQDSESNLQSKGQISQTRVTSALKVRESKEQYTHSITEGTETGDECRLRKERYEGQSS